ncbi:hypothetical protein BDFG_00144 [Blastomyces dermatitidis ATCC 26199]|nr:hypothetical protein BDFG_00144 [Blastomyces dermatitidis ATCC 26199]
MAVFFLWPPPACSKRPRSTSEHSAPPASQTPSYVSLSDQKKSTYKSADICSPSHPEVVLRSVYVPVTVIIPADG